MDKLVLIDGNAIAYRAFFALPLLVMIKVSIRTPYMVLQICF